MFKREPEFYQTVRHFFSLLMLVGFCLPVAQAQTKFVPYKNYLIPIDAGPFRECTDQDPGGSRPRVIVTTDLQSFRTGSDPDDIQSLVHLLVSNDQFEVLGLISTPGSSDPAVARPRDNITNLVNAYELDYNQTGPAELTALGYQSPTQLRSVVRQGLRRNRTDMDTIRFDPNNPSHEGAKLILEEAQAVLDGDKCGPVYVLVWGAIPDLALALKESERRGLGIERVLRTYFVASFNRRNGRPEFRYIYDNFLTQDRLWFIQSESTFIGMFSALGSSAEEGTNNIRDKTNNRLAGAPQSCLRYALGRASARINEVEPSFRIKAGDTPSLLYVMDGDLDDPTSASWGGEYKLVAGKTQWWIDRSIGNPAATRDTAQTFHNGSDYASVSSHIPDIIADWERSMNRFVRVLPARCRSVLAPTFGD